MNPVSTQTISRLVWIALLTSKGRKSLDRVGSEVLGDGEDAEDHLQSVEQQGDDEVGIGDGLCAIAHVRSFYLSVMR